MAGCHGHRVTTKERVFDRGTRNGQRSLAMLAGELREARLLHGLSQADVGRAAGVSAAAVSRAERGRAAGAPILSLVRIATAVGLDLHIRAYPGGDAVRDAGHRRLLGRLRALLPAGTGWATEVPLPMTQDQRAWDAVITTYARVGDAHPRQCLIGVEAETRLRDLQALQRRLALKRRDGGVDRLVLLVADTRSNRAILLAADGLPFPELPMPQADALRALKLGQPLVGNALIRL